MKVRFITNAKAGSAGRLKGLASLVREILGSERGIFEVRAANGPGAAAALSREAREKGYEFVFACGGDGTINTVASELVGSRTALGVVPAGSGNALARTLGVPMDAAGAIRLLKTGRVIDIDVGVAAAGRYFFTTAGFGFEAHLSRRYSEGRIARRMRGTVPYYVLAAVEYLRYRPERVSLEVDGMQVDLEPFIFTVANMGQWGAGALIAPGARFDDGQLDFCVTPRAGLARTLGLGYRVMRGSVESFKGFQCFRGSKAVIRGRSASCAHVDGEPFDAPGDVAISVLPGALRVLAPGS